MSNQEPSLAVTNSTASVTVDSFSEQNQSIEEASKTANFNNDVGSSVNQHSVTELSVDTKEIISKERESMQESTKRVTTDADKERQSHSTSSTATTSVDGLSVCHQPSLQIKVRNEESDKLPIAPQSDPGISSPPSPTESVSSLSSSDSTEKLIENLTVTGGVPGKETSRLQEMPTDVPVPSSDGNLGEIQTVQTVEPNESKKPVKFTVRKISREGTTSYDDKGENKRSVLRRYGNLPENQPQAVDRKTGDKEYQLKHNQAKYDQYVIRMDKIEKEIRFLSTLLPPYNVEIDYATRSKITRAIEKLRSKKDEVDKKKYELGMSISRLWREFDDSNTWVRSVSKH